MTREIITHMYCNSGSYRAIDKITGWLRAHGLYKLVDTIDIVDDNTGIAVGRFESIEGFGPLVKLLSALSDFRNSGNRTIVYTRNDTGKFKREP